MIFHALGIDDVYLIEPELREDDRGFFARVWCEAELAAMGLTPTIAQANISFTRERGLVRGMHYQIAPYEEAKTVRCTRGAIYDVAIDLRPTSPTYGRWVGAELTAENRRMLYVPEGFAHGFQTLTTDVEVTYQVSAHYTPGSERGIRYDDPGVAIEWPLPVTRVSEKDRSWPDHAALAGSRGMRRAVEAAR